MPMNFCVVENCPAFWTGLRWTTPDDANLPDSVMEHTHMTAGGQTFTTPRPPTKWSAQGEAFLAAMHNHCLARIEYERTYQQLRELVRKVPAGEEDELLAESLTILNRHGISLDVLVAFKQAAQL